MSNDAPAQEPKISIEHVYKIFGEDPQSVLPQVEAGADKREILEQTGHVIGIRDISLQIQPGETFVVMGLSGSGKSTLIRHVNRLIEPTAGQILIDGQDVLTLDEKQLRDLRRQKISMVFQKFALLPHRSVLSNVMYPLKVGGVSTDKAKAAAMEQIETVGLAGYEDRYPRHLSGGMQQRVGLARALATSGDVLLMDEAFSALDPLIRGDMQAQLKTLQAKLHKTIMFITHDLDEALLLGDHIAILNDGELRQVGTGEDILLNPADDYVARFVRDVNRGRVVTLATTARTPTTLSASDLSRDKLEQALTSVSEAVIVTDADGRPVAAVTEGHLHANRDKAEDWWRSPDNLPTPQTADETTVLAEILPLFAGSETPLAVVNSNGVLVGKMAAADALAALSNSD
ncbi:quaternary amine ABC transporter ATP-binding protein [Amorphus orientalis]|uniref:Quaternary amine transport ATP-binding protein n=1 Tax=Amorphus orientalis TaxID=649198 RepID=A0AAE3VNZ7_9HYPH|nr:glycine betaine/L-proline ABC transporter ATP-binding protein [Amorphus orientalis]MDQ0315587.1 glycine betaine/proline transport system ATP-binding protein [Amorphus orientalis]